MISTDAFTINVSLITICIYFLVTWMSKKLYNWNAIIDNLNIYTSWMFQGQERERERERERENYEWRNENKVHIYQISIYVSWGGIKLSMFGLTKQTTAMRIYV